jgi:hypothetical protein
LFVLGIVVMTFGILSPVFSQEGEVEGSGITLTWEIEGEYLLVSVKAPTDGWVAVGFKPERAMQGANIIIGYVEKDGTVVVEDHYGTRPIAHQSDVSMGGTRDVERIEGSETGGFTTISFAVPMQSDDEYDAPLAAGETFPVLLAYGARDNFRIKHPVRTVVEITL